MRAEERAYTAELLDQAEAVIIGAGAGLSTSAGFTYSGERFERYFEDFIEQYHLSDMYSAGFYPFQTPEERWAYWSRHIYVNRFLDPPEDTYHDLLDLVEKKDYFVLTTNVDHQFQKAGFEKKRIFYTQGDYGLFQCSLPCCQKTYDNETQVFSMLASQGIKLGEHGEFDIRGQKSARTTVGSELIPRCPVCKRPMAVNLRCDHTFVEDDGWREAHRRYEDFLGTHRDRRVVFLELGVGSNTPGIIKFHFWKFTKEWPRADYICINKGEAFVPRELEEKSVCIDADIDGVLRELL